MRPYDWQQPCVDQMVASIREYGISANVSATGVGKTLMTCFAAKMLDKNLAVVCPKSVIPSWREAAEMSGVGVEFVNNYEQLVRVPKKREWTNEPARWEIHKRVYRWFLPKGTLLVFDEAHRCTGQTSQNSKMLIAAAKQKIPTVLLSATLCESPLKMKAVGYALGLHALNSYPHEFKHWLMTNRCEQNNFGQLVYTGGVSHMTELRSQMGSRVCGIQHADLGDKFPSNKIILLTVPVDVDDIDKEYYDCLEEMRVNSQDEITACLRARQKSEIAKLKSFVEMAKDAEGEGNSVFAAVNFRETHSLLLDRLGRDKTSFICGGQSSTLREEEIRSFSLNQRHHMVSMIQAGGVGVDGLQDLYGRPRISLISPSHSAVEFRQVLGRIHRANSLSPAIQYVLFAEGSDVETRIKKNLQSKLANLDALNDSDLAIEQDAI